MNYECEQKLVWPGFKIILQKYPTEISKVIDNLGIAGFRTEIEPGASRKIVRGSLTLAAHLII